jgi:hypothetical protein
VEVLAVFRFGALLFCLCDIMIEDEDEDEDEDERKVVMVALWGDLVVVKK